MPKLTLCEMLCFKTKRGRGVSWWWRETGNIKKGVDSSSGARRWRNATESSPHNNSLHCAQDSIPQHICVRLWWRDQRSHDHVICRLARGARVLLSRTFPRSFVRRMTGSHDIQMPIGGDMCLGLTYSFSRLRLIYLCLTHSRTHAYSLYTISAITDIAFENFQVNDFTSSRLTWVLV